MPHLPTYADNKIGRALVSEIIAERPEARVRNHRLPSIYGGYSDGTTISYSGKPAALLRRLRSEWIERELAALDVQFHVTGGLWDEDASTAILSTETADQLIERVLAEAVSELRAA